MPLVASGFAHEAYEIVGHVHGYELHGALTDAAGAVAGVVCAGAMLSRRILSDADVGSRSRFHRNQTRIIT